MAYYVGQVLFVLPTKGSARIVPVQVIEEITKKTLQGSITTYMVKLIIDNESTVVDIKSIEGEVFDSHDSVKKTLIERSTTAILKMVERAIEHASSLYSYDRTKQNQANDVIVEQETEDDDNVAILDDGTKVRVVMPDSLK